ncbi:MAG: hypothetical protein KKE69_02145 [Alphaproteobacteria bacterium]|jgi:hypothetical protein|nr:hypothetical protein [Alphaproteobacteria bacterium]MBU1605421.1 hypothetical protein [Alphaproteobacteria bacterium]
MRASFLLPALVLVPALTACGPSDNDPGPGGVTVGEARALDEAAAMIDERQTPAEALAEQPSAGPGPASAPEPTPQGKDE